MLSVELQQSGDWIVVRLGGECGASRVTEVERMLHHRVVRSADDRGLEIDLGAVTFLDKGMLGVFLGIRDELMARGRVVRFSTPSPAVASLLGTMGVDRVLDLDV
jgi:anti-anti-sigma factor